MSSLPCSPRPWAASLRTNVDPLEYALGAHPVGRVLCAVGPQGLCAVLLGDDPVVLMADLQARFVRANLTASTSRAQRALQEVLAAMNGDVSAPTVPLHLVGTPFERRVWAELMAIPRGETRSYGAVARALGAPGAARAVGRACGSNNLAFVVPCHRVVHRNGQITGYRWGPTIKRQLLALEQRACGIQKSA